MQYTLIRPVMGNVTAHTIYLWWWGHISWWRMYRMTNYCQFPNWYVTINRRGWILWASEVIAEYYKRESKYLQLLRNELPNRISAAVNNYVRIHIYVFTKPQTILQRNKITVII